MRRAGWQAVLFDLDGTLADTVELILRSFRHTMRTHLGTVPPDSAFLAGIGKPLPVQLAGFAEDEGQRMEMLATYVEYQRSIHDGMVRPFPGALEVVTELRSRGSPTAIVTSKGRSIAGRTLRVCGLHEAFDFVVCADEVERGKPDPEPVVRALGALGVDDAGSVVFVGDSPHDLKAGRAAGVRTAAVEWGPIERRVLEAERPDFFLARMDDLLEIAPG
ncbi:MAG: HAD-IA family hydrolase [Longimicrobiales bacterium]|nr:HAD-IA family hydrolase [Longimicrobiales bacterium]